MNNKGLKVVSLFDGISCGRIALERAGIPVAEYLACEIKPELERLQTLPEGYTKVLNRNKAAGVIGDGWTVDVIVHIFKFLKNESEVVA